MAFERNLSVSHTHMFGRCYFQMESLNCLMVMVACRVTNDSTWKAEIAPSFKPTEDLLAAEKLVPGCTPGTHLNCLISNAFLRVKEIRRLT